MSSVTTYQSLQTQGLITINYSLISENFRVIDDFLKSFPAFQRRIVDLQKMQKATTQDLSNFKLSTQNTFSTINDIVETRVGASKGSSLADNEEIKTIKKQFKQLKTFITENARQQHQAQQHRDKEALQTKQVLQKKISELKKQLQEKQERIIGLEEENREIKIKYISKLQINSQNKVISQNIEKLQSSAEMVNQIQQMLDKLDVKNMKQTIDSFKRQLGKQFQEIKRKVKLKSDYSDIVKLEEMLLNIINFGNENCFKSFADKLETKKALTFLQKKINKLLQTLFGEQQGDKDGLVVTKGWKCISCTKDLGQLQGKLDKYKAWSIFPVKDPQIKDRYSGFGAGFQTIVESTVAKKGGQVSFDEKGRMTAPFNLTRQVQGSILKPSQSQTKMGRQSSAAKFQSSSKNGSPTKPMQLQTNYMMSYGRNSQLNINLIDEYMKRQRGIMAHVRYIIQGTTNNKNEKV